MAEKKSTMYDLEAEKIREKIIIFAVDAGGYTQKEVSLEVQASLDELAELIDTAGGEVVGRLVQNRDKIANDLYLGRGKVEELRNMIYELGATGVCCDDELSPAQLMNLQDALDIKVMDRTMVILDIFAAHAGSYEGKLQVELAQLKFRATRLIGMRDSLSRLGGGIGTRGPGEKKLEIDRRVIRDRISRLKEDKLFATLDPTTRNYRLPGGQNILLTDTVGFIRKLPHHLVEAFGSTLEEAKYCDVIIHVVDASDVNWDKNIETVYHTLKQLKIDEKSGKPIITVFNKVDKIEKDDLVGVRDLRADRTIYVSAKNGQGLDELASAIEEILRNQKIYIRHTFAYSDAGLTGLIHKYGEIKTEEYLDDGIFIEAYVPSSILGRLGLGFEDEEEY